MPYAIALDGVRIYYEFEGTGEPLLLIAGQANDHHLWDLVRSDFARRYQIIVYDLRGTGLSDKPEQPPYTTRGFANDAIAILDAIGLKRAHAYGVSMGGAIAQWLGIDHGDRLGALVLGCITAGAALVALHNLGPSDCFGPCWRDGTCAEEHPQDAQEYVSRRFSALIEKAIQGGYISPAELSTVRAAYALVPAFEGERPIPCHRDYCAANWLVSPEGALAGIIDFEFAYWDVRVADFARDPDWAWIRRPDLMEAFFDGYIGNGGRSFSRTTELQLLVARAEYALDAILWGHDFAFYGFEQEGREALFHLARP
jgi:pimeloyl-ACP methyl ester carboxylesterase